MLPNQKTKSKKIIYTYIKEKKSVTRYLKQIKKNKKLSCVLWKTFSIKNCVCVFNFDGLQSRNLNQIEFITENNNKKTLKSSNYII